ncbi:hypothetical protein B0H19DRAFT_1275579 [Mycena capillaripes]|nr:hypothetical protein B0H19DRAFT_1275579 [Mycena capillaripes]
MQLHYRRLHTTTTTSGEFFKYTLKPTAHRDYSDSNASTHRDLFTFNFITIFVVRFVAVVAGFKPKQVFCTTILSFIFLFLVFLFLFIPISLRGRVCAFLLLPRRNDQNLCARRHPRGAPRIRLLSASPRALCAPQTGPQRYPALLIRRIPLPRSGPRHTHGIVAPDPPPIPTDQRQLRSFRGRRAIHHAQLRPGFVPTALKTPAPSLLGGRL